MKQLIDFRPSFNPTAKTLDFSFKPGGFQINRLYSVVNVTQAIPIYIMGASGFGLTNVSNGVITLVYDTSLHAATDILNVVYDELPGNISNVPVENGGQLQAIQETLNQMLVEMRIMNMLLSEGFNGRNLSREDISMLRQDINNIDVSTF